MAVTFTPEQQKVIDLRDRNILVSAAAGSGKTAVLVERIVAKITDEARPVDIDRLLVVTFTNAAAAEMRERISRALDQRLAQNPENEHLQRQTTLLHNAQITTIDSFCLYLIRNNFNDIGLDPGFRVADEGELKLLRQDVLTELLEQYYQEGKEEFLACVEYFTGGSNDKLLEEYIDKLYEFSMSYPWPEDWIGQCMDDYNIASVTEMEKTDWCQYLLTCLNRIIEECVALYAKALEITGQPSGPYMYGELLETEKEMLERLLTCAQKRSLQALYEGLDAVAFGRLPGKKDETVDGELRERVKQMRSEVKKRLEDMKVLYFALSPEQVFERMQSAAPNVKMLLRLVLSYKEMLDEKKRRENMIDFHDMEHFALKVLLEKHEDKTVTPSQAALSYRQYFEEILIDEYQDSNLVQELLLKSISGEEEGHFNRFMVGDVKQSIYKFRLARPELFMEKYDCYSKVDGYQKEDMTKCQRIDLHRNFRSRPQVLESVNCLFEQIMGKDLGGVTYDEDAALYPGSRFPEEEGTSDYATECLIAGREDASPLSPREQEASLIAARIKKLRRELQVTDKESGNLRPVRYSDMVILLRTTAGWAQEFKRVLEQEGIPAYVASRTGYFQATEIKALLEYLHVIDNPLQDIPLYGTLKSFFGGFEEEQLAEIRSENKEISLYRLLTEYQGVYRERIDEFLEKLETYRRMTAYTPIHKLIQRILSDIGYLDYVTARPGGEQRRANVEMLLTRAAAFENTSYYGLFHFLRYMEQLEKYEVDYGEADVLDENAEVVRIMSIHKSKGLEFPVCFVAGLAKRFNMQDTTGRLIADVDMGIGVDYVDSNLRLQSRTLKKNAVALKMKIDALGEEMRVLYVAMTRAREKLILTATVTDLEKLGERRKKGVSFASLSSAVSYLDFVLPCMEEITLIPPEELFQEEVKQAAKELERKKTLLVNSPDEKIMTQMSEQFSRTYTNQCLEKLYVKTTVSELKMKSIHNLPERSIDEEQVEGQTGGKIEKAFTRELFEEPEVVPYIPSFIDSKEKITGTERGSAYHKVMELLDFAGICSRVCDKQEGEKGAGEEIQRQMDILVKEGRLTKEWAESINIAKLLTFFKSPLACRMAKAQTEGKLRREQPFVYGISAKRLDESFPEQEKVLIQGIIDVFFEEDGKLVVADYKTDAVKTEEELIKRYKVQLDYYEEALQKLTGKNIAAKVIYSFTLGKEIVLY